MKYLREHPNYLVIAGVSIIIVVLLFLSGCAKANEPFKDAPTKGRNSTPAEIIEMPDGFSNVAAKCDGANMVYVIFKSDSKYGALSVVPNDPRCSGGTTP